MSNKSYLTKYKIRLIIGCLCFSPVGTLSKLIPWPAAVISMFRGLTGTLIFYIIMRAKGNKLDIKNIMSNWKMLFISGVVLALDWLFCIEAVKIANVSLVSVILYSAPIMVIMSSPILFREKLNKKTIFCALVTFFGMAIISGVFNESGVNISLAGFLLALGGAVFYAGTTILNKFLPPMRDIDRSTSQFLVCTIVVSIYCLFKEDLTSVEFTASSIFYVTILGAICVASAYGIYFSVMNYLPSQTISILSYFDPLGSVVLALLILHEPINFSFVLGAICILGGTMMCEFLNSPKKEKYKDIH